MKKMIASLVFAFTMIICSVSYGHDKSPPESEQTIKKAMNECFQNAVNVNEEFQMIQPIAYEASAEFTVKKAACGYQDFAESTAIKDAPAFAVEDATLFYILNIKTTKREKTDKSDYAKIKYSMADWRL